MFKPLRPFDTLPHFDFMRQRYFWIVFSLVFSLLSMGFVAYKGLNYGIDFVGGKLVQVQTVRALSIGDVREAVDGAGFAGATIQQYGAANEYLIRLPGNDANTQPATAESAITQAIGARSGGADLRRVEFVGPQVGNELKVKGMMAMLVATVAILIYVWFRFELFYGLGAILALLHDVVLTIGFMVAVNMEITLTVLAAILTLIGYSLNDTIVIFDRVRENRIKYPNRPLTEVVNLSVNQTLARTFMTVSTVLLVLLSLIFFGGEVIRDFSVVLLVGTLLGTYSSVFVAGALLVWLQQRFGRPTTRTDVVKA